MKYFVLLFIGATTLSSQALASGCTEMAAFNTKIDNFLETASLSEGQKADIKQLATKCEGLHNQGVAVGDILPCNAALEMTEIN